MPENFEKRPDYITLFFTGVYYVIIDAHNRIVIPAPCVKQGLTEECFIVPGRSADYRWLTIFPVTAFNDHSEPYTRRGVGAEGEFLERKRCFFPGARKQPLNPNKPRITLDESMLEHLFEGKPVAGETLALIGVGNSLELWRRDVFEAWWKFEKPKVEQWLLNQKPGPTNP
jgi:DNA-binding transcriptional regulator/RsmH inhibitor MraZ